MRRTSLIVQIASFRPHEIKGIYILHSYSYYQCDPFLSCFTFLHKSKITWWVGKLSLPWYFSTMNASWVRVRHVFNADCCEPSIFTLPPHFSLSNLALAPLFMESFPVFAPLDPFLRLDCLQISLSKQHAPLFSPQLRYSLWIERFTTNNVSLSKIMILDFNTQLD